MRHGDANAVHTSHRPALLAGALLAAACLAPHALAQADGADAPPADAGSPALDAGFTGGLLTGPIPPDQAWTVQGEVVAWYVSPGGKLTLPGSGDGQGRVDASVLNLDSPRLSPYVELHLRADRGRLTFSGFDVSIEGDFVGDGQTPIFGLGSAAGDAFESALDFSSYEATGAYRFWHYADGRRADGTWRLIAGLEPLVGVRLHDADVRVRRLAGGVAEADEVFGEPVAGLRLDLQMYERLSVEVHTSLGWNPLGDERSSFSWDVAVGVTWRPVRHVGVQVGYRQLAFDLEDGEGTERFRFRGAMAGVFAGVTVRF